MIKKLEVGDIFNLKLENKNLFIFGRVLFDVDSQLKKSKANDENYFTTYAGCHLIEIYKGIYDSPNLPDSMEVLIPRVFVFKIDSKANSLKWEVAGHHKVDVKNIEFPEVVGNAYNEVRLMRGELYFKTAIKDPIQYPGVLPAPEYPVVILDASLGLQGREDLIDGDYYDESLTDLDLLYHPDERKQIYSDLNLDPDKSYYELSKEMGFDLARFYKH
ncbi:Imm26 family immunity protein [Chryseobacterium sp. WG23]|uniref:Imm26 family immunity protein n=1 Tax=Chryseobacterium sp. WG23 TaxID=2926910 RepID=UPI00211E2C97|nr:Imm26 family immunity protein [Chryseobacterium sp. WG23]MCQ9637308.1 Imm26 family immunity protein [Chryseobacterium sp. WG23]